MTKEEVIKKIKKMIKDGYEVKKKYYRRDMHKKGVRYERRVLSIGDIKLVQKIKEYYEGEGHEREYKLVGIGEDLSSDDMRDIYLLFINILF